MRTYFTLQKRRNEFGEYQIKSYVNGQRHPDGDYFTEDWDDALGTKTALDLSCFSFKAKGFRSLGDSQLNWWLLNTIDDDKIVEFMEYENIRQYNSGPGQPYSSKPVIRQTNSRTLITQRSGWDI